MVQNIQVLGVPVVTVIGVVLDFVGVATLSNFCYLVFQTNYLNKDVHIGIHWNGSSPNYTQRL